MNDPQFKVTLTIEVDVFAANQRAAEEFVATEVSTNGALTFVSRSFALPARIQRVHESETTA